VTNLTIRFDLRRPPFSKATMAELYAACLDQCEWADRHGFDTVVLSEHHGVEDGYLPSPLVMAAAIGARTSRMHISISALLVPLHDPLRLAEDVAVADLASGGRVSLVAGLGYRDAEFEMFGVDARSRGKAAEEAIAVMRRAWTGEPFEYRGATVRVTPTPLQRPHPPVLMGGSSETAARRAARLGLPFLPAIGDPALAAAYQEECERVGFGEGFVLLPSGPAFLHVTEDPERAWAEIAPHALYDSQTYASWQRPGQRSVVTTGASTAEELRQTGVYAVVTPEQCLEMVERQGVGGLVFHPLMGGLSPELGWESLELFASKVLPRLPGRAPAAT